MIFVRAALAVLTLTCLTVVATAAENETKSPSDVVAAEELSQIALTDTHMTGFIAVQTELVAMADELEAQNTAPEADLREKLDAVAKRHGFESFEAFDNVASTVALVMEGIDPDTNTYTDPKEVIASDIEDVKKDTTLSDEERAEVIADLEEARDTTPDLKHPENVDMVRKYVEQLVKLVQ